MKYIFYLTDHGLTAYSDSAKYASREEVFTWNDVTLIDDYLAKIPEKAEAYLVLDVLDEDIHFEWAPKVMPWEKATILARRKERVQGENVALSEVKWTGEFQKSDEGRNEELILSAAVMDSFNINNFLQSLEEAQIVLKAIYSKPFLLVDYFNKLARTTLSLSRQDLKNPFLLITRQSKKAFRQTFFYNGELRISRVVELDKAYDDAVQIRNALIQETKLAVKYVYNQKIVPFNSPIGLVFLDGEESVLEGMLQQCNAEDLIRSTWEPNQYVFATATFKQFTPEGLNCRQLGGDCFSQQSVVDYIFTSPPQGFYKNPYVSKINNILQARRVFISINILIFLGSLYYVLISGIDTYLSWQKQAMLEQKIALYESEKHRLQELVKLQADAQEIKASVEFSESILKLKVDSLLGFNINDLSGAVLRHPNIQLSKVDWKIVDRFDSKKSQIELNGWVFPFHETYLAPVTWVDQFVADLKTLKGIESVDLQKEPLNRELSQTLLIDAKMGEVRALPFTVTLRVNDVESK